MGCGCGCAERVHRKKESRVFHEDLISALEMGSESEERSQQMFCYTMGDWFGMN